MLGTNHLSLMALVSLTIGREIKIYLGSINDRVWEVIEHDFVILIPLTPPIMREQTSNAIQ
jgi:hypothetical protein